MRWRREKFHRMAEIWKLWLNFHPIESETAKILLPSWEMFISYIQILFHRLHQKMFHTYTFLICNEEFVLDTEYSRGNTSHAHTYTQLLLILKGIKSHLSFLHRLSCVPLSLFSHSFNIFMWLKLLLWCRHGKG